MKKKLTKSLIGMTAALILLAMTSMQVKSQSFEVGDKDVNLGIGFGATWYSGVGYKTTIPPVCASLDFGFKDDIGPGVLGLGGYVGFSSYKWEYSYLYTYGYKYTTFILGGRATYHMEFIDKLDTYGGLLLGFRLVNDKYFGDIGYTYTSGVGSGLAYSFFIGGKYYLADNIAVFGELGYGIAYLTLGVTFKMK
ncbi:MAG: hypothetical protein JW723_15970 [Bacteroidales bacterium]|nr:hypothetical protein [Bacteroidales bacterium]